MPRDGQREVLTEGAVKAHLAAFADRGVISKWAVPERVILADAIARTSVGKTDKKALRQRFGQS